MLTNAVETLYESVILALIFMVVPFATFSGLTIMSLTTGGLFGLIIVLILLHAE